MHIGLALPATIAAAPRDALVTWSARAEAEGFAALAAPDRVAGDALDPFAALTVAATVTDRLALLAYDVLVSVRPAAMLAKQAATLDALAAGRVTLAVAAAGSAADHAVAGLATRATGRRLDAAIGELRRLWGAQARGMVPLGPATVWPGGPQVLTGGTAGDAAGRVERGADGWLAAPVTAGEVAAGAAIVRSAGARAGRPAPARVVAMLPAMDDAATFKALGAFATAGADLAILTPTSAHVEELERLADIAFGADRAPVL